MVLVLAIDVLAIDVLAISSPAATIFPLFLLVPLRSAIHSCLLITITITITAANRLVHHAKTKRRRRRAEMDMAEIYLNNL